MNIETKEIVSKETIEDVEKVKIAKIVKKVTFTGCKYNHGNKGPSKRGFDITVSTNPNDWFLHSNFLLCKGLELKGIMYSKRFVFRVIDSVTFVFKYEGEDTYTENSPQNLLKKISNKSLSASAMFVFGAPTIQKIASVISSVDMASSKSLQYEDEYYKIARKSLDDFLNDFENDNLKDSYENY